MPSYRKSAQVDMTHGSVLGRAALFALPICAGNILQLLYSTVDTLVIGNFCDTTALASVATSSQPLEILLCVFVGIGSGISILVSQAVGRADHDQLQKLVRTSVWLLFAASLPLTVIGFLLGPWMLQLMQVPADAMPGAVLYLRITMLGILGNMGYNFNAGLLRGIGNSSSSLLLLFISCAANVVLDLVLTGALGLGIGGVAAATAIALFLSWICSIFYIRRRCTELALPVLPCGFDAGALRQIVRIGLPLGLNSALYSIGHVFLQVLYNLQGSVFVAGCSVAGKVGGLANITVTSLSQATSVFAGQNLGAQSYSRLRRGGWLLPAASGLLSLAGGLLMAACCRPLLLLFTQDEAVLAFAVRYIRVVLPFQWCYAAFNAIMSFANGMGEIRYSTIVNIILLWGVRIPASYLLAWLGYGGYAMAGVSLSFVVGLLAMLFYYKSHAWADICAHAEAQESAK